MLCFQFGGESERGLPAAGAWRRLAVAELIDVSVHHGPWFSGRDYDPAQSCVEEIDVAI